MEAALGLQRWVQDNHVPLVMCNATPRADGVCRKNGLSFAELVRPFGVVQSSGVPIRTVSRSYTLKRFRVRFVDAAALRPPTLPELDTRLLRVTSGQVPKDTVRDQYEGRFRRPRGGGPGGGAGVESPWVESYRSEILLRTRCQDHEMFDQPLALVLVAASTDENPIRCFDQLASRDALPLVFKRGLYDSTVAKFFILLHDNRDGGRADHLDEKKIFSQMQRTFPASNCHLLCINSLSVMEPNLTQPDIWSQHIEPPLQAMAVPLPDRADPGAGLPPALTADTPAVPLLPPDPVGPAGALAAAGAAAAVGGGGGGGGGGPGRPVATSSVGSAEGGRPLGHFLSGDDLLAIKKMMDDLVVKGILRELEKRMFALDTQVTATRKGLRNMLKGMWGGGRSSKKDSGASSAAAAALFQSQLSAGVEPPRYYAQSIESNIRLLADLAFMVHDYEMALGLYRMVRDDYKGDKAWLHHAGACEMVALSQFMLDGVNAQLASDLRRGGGGGGGGIQKVQP